jgi:hypothetical protein
VVASAQTPTVSERTDAEPTDASSHSPTTPSNRLGTIAQPVRRHWGDIVFVTGLIAIGALVIAANQMALGANLGSLVDGLWTTPETQVSVAVILVLIAVVAGMAWERTYLPTVWAIAPLLPGLAAICVVATFLAAPASSGAAALVIGSEMAFAIVIIGAIPLRMLANVRVAQTRSYWELRRRSDQLSDRLKTMTVSIKDPTPTQEMAIAEAAKQLHEVNDALLKPPEESQTNGLEWVSAMGYVSLTRRVDRAEEALYELEPLGFLLGDALHDRLRMAGADIKSDEMKSDLSAAVKVISPDAYDKYFVTVSPAGAVPGSANADRMTPQERRADHPERHVLNEDPVARAMLREVRNGLNVYFEDRMEGIVRARNRLWRAILLTATTTFLLVGLAVLNGVAKPQIIAASVFFLVAAIVGLFNLLRLQAKSDTAVEDFNLFEARLVHTPLLSGLAGVAGVVIVAMAANAAADAASLSKIFDLSENRLGLLVAAAFGLAPDRIIGPLLSQTERLKGQLQAGKAAVGTTAASTAVTNDSQPT